MKDVEDNTYGFYCDHKGLCGRNGVKFNSTGWPTQELAMKRGLQHLEEHETKVPMQALHEFRNENGVNEDGTIG